MPPLQRRSLLHRAPIAAEVVPNTRIPPTPGILPSPSPSRENCLFRPDDEEVGTPPKPTQSDSASNVNTTCNSSDYAMSPADPDKNAMGWKRDPASGYRTLIHDSQENGQKQNQTSAEKEKFSVEISREATQLSQIRHDVEEKETIHRPIDMRSESCLSRLSGAADSLVPQVCGDGLDRPGYIGVAKIVEDIITASENAAISLSNVYIDRVEDADSIATIVANRRLLISNNYTHWSPLLVSLGLGVLLMLGVRDINMQEMVHFLYLAQGGEYLRSHDGQTYLYGDGAFFVFNGLLPESLLSRCKIFAQCVEGALWCISSRGVQERGEMACGKAIDESYRN